MIETSTRQESLTPSLDSSLREYGRGIAGGMIFSLPLLYTMEVWWAGFTIEPLRLLIYVLGTFLLLLGYNRYAGLHEDASWPEVVIDSVEEMGIGLVIAAAFLALLGRIALDMGASENIGKVVMEGMTVAIGVSVGTAQLGGGGRQEGEEGNDPKPRRASSGDELPGVYSLDQWVIGLCGAVLIGGNIAPTDEIEMIAVGISSWSMIGLVAMSFMLGILILFFSEFPGSRPLPGEGRFIAVASRGIETYATALVSAALLLWFFGRFDGVSFSTGLSQAIVLGVATTLGAAAGRLLLR